MLLRNRLSRGSLDAHILQGQAITGTPCEVPVPRNVTFKTQAIILVFLLDFLLQELRETLLYLRFPWRHPHFLQGLPHPLHRGYP